MIGQAVSHYRILSKLGEGGMGVVYKVRDVNLDRLAALKVLTAGRMSDAERTSRFIREAKAASALNHPNVVTIYEIVEDPAAGNHYIAMELIEGETLRALAARPTPPALVSETGRQAAEALAVAHAAGIVHRDIKPENLMLRRDGYVKILDFGLARLLREEPTNSNSLDTLASQPAGVFGTLAYMSPEQAHGIRLTGASDVFSLGLVLYELATGQHPFSAASQLLILQALLSEQPIPPSRLRPEIAPVLEDVILRMLRKDPVQRPSAGEVAEMLARHESGKSQAVAAAPSFSPRRETVGREKERQELRFSLENCRAGRGGLVCVTGEPGIGKSTLVEDFLSEAAGCDAAVGKGRCSERLAGTEAYLPILEALDNLLRESEGSRLARVMKLLAPTWYVQVALHSSDSGADRLTAETKGASQERMKRELHALFSEVARFRPVIIVLDDLHWADVSTVDILAYLADRCATMRLLVIGTYRPTDLLLGAHPFLRVKLEQESRGNCREIPLGFLSLPEVEAYLAIAFPRHRFPPEFGSLIYRRTEGSPLFMVDLLRYLRDRGILDDAGSSGGWTLTQPIQQVEGGLPDSVRSMIRSKIDRLNEADRKLLAAASVQGSEFDTATVSRAIGGDPAEVEELLEPLERVHGFVRQIDETELPAGGFALRYRFVHVLYQNAFYDSLRPTRRTALSQSMAQAMEDLYGGRCADVASQLAFLYETAREPARAVKYFILAARHASQVSAHREAADLARRGLRLVQSLPAGAERAGNELSLQLALLIPLMSLKGYAAPEVEAICTRAHSLCNGSGSDAETYQALMGLGAFYFFRPRLQIALELCDKMLPLAEASQNNVLLSFAHFAAGSVMSHTGELCKANRHIESCLEAYEPEKHSQYVSTAGFNPGIVGRSQYGRLLWLMGHPGQAKLRLAESLTDARKLGHSYSICFALTFYAWVLEYCGDSAECLKIADEAVQVACDEGYTMHHAWARILRGWALSESGAPEEGISQMKEGLEGMRVLGAELIRPEFLSLLAGAEAKSGDPRNALDLVEQGLAIVDATGEHYYDAELFRLKGLFLLALSPDRAGECECLLQRAKTIAVSRESRSFELRAANSLARLYLEWNQPARARGLLAPILGRFKEGEDTRDLNEARELLRLTSRACTT